MKKILFPTDFSSAADHAFIYALKVADHLGAAITTVHAYHLPYVQAVHLPRTLKEVYDSILIHEFENYRDHIPHLRKIAEDNGMSHIRIRHAMVEARSDIVKTILQVAKDEKTEMIIMGTTGASGLKEIFLGSVAAEMLENACCPVLAVPSKAVFDGALNKIAMTTEFAEAEHDVLKKVIGFARQFNAEVHCVHIDTAHTEPYAHKMEEFRKDFTSEPNVYFEVIDAMNVEGALTSFIEANDIDILAMLTHKRSFFQELFTYSLTKKLAYHISVPILAFHKGEGINGEIDSEVVSNVNDQR